MLERVHWEDWTSGAQWVHPDADFLEGLPRATSGTRYAYEPWHGTLHHQLAGPKPKIYVQGVSPGFQPNVCGRAGASR
jgi:hypothetical protein